MAKSTLNLCCPKCGQSVEAELKKNKLKFILYLCPQCRSNVVYYKRKIDVISDGLVKTLRAHNKLTQCGNTRYKKTREPDRITEESILDLKILLATEQDSRKIIAQL